MTVYDRPLDEALGRERTCPSALWTRRHPEKVVVPLVCAGDGYEARCRATVRARRACARDTQIV